MPDILQSSEVLLEVIALLGIELLALVILVSIVVWVLKLVYKNVLARSSSEKVQERIKHSWHLFKLFVVLLTVLAVMGIVAVNGWLVWQNKHPLDFTFTWLQSIPRAVWLSLLYGVGKIIVAAIVAKYLVDALQRVLTLWQEKLSAFSHLNQDDDRLPKFFSSLTQVLSTAVWMLFAVFVTRQLLMPELVQQLLLKLITIYLIVGIGIIAARMVSMIVATVDALSARYVENKSWSEYYNSLHPLMPLLRRSLEYVIWIGTATLVLAQLSPVAQFAQYGPRLIQAIGIFFLSRVVIEAGYLLIDSQPEEVNSDDLAQRRRATIVPLIKTIFRHLTYFIALVMILGVLGVDIMPFLAGAGILGVVIGFGAQPLINDIVSGFFILFENIFLVDDVIDTGKVLGRVEHIDFRTTKIRDPDGNLHILRNGDLSHVKNYSKDFTFAVVEVRVGYEVNVTDVRKVLEECGKKIVAAEPEFVTGDLVIAGIVEFEPSAMRFRTTTPVKPAKHFVVATQLREIIKQAFDEKGWTMPSSHQQVSFVSEVAG